MRLLKAHCFSFDFKICLIPTANVHFGRDIFAKISSPLPLELSYDCSQYTCSQTLRCPSAKPRKTKLNIPTFLIFLFVINKQPTLCIKKKQQTQFFSIKEALGIDLL